MPNVVKGFWNNTIDFEPVSELKSETIPDQALSVRDILHRFTVSGQRLPDVDWDGSDDLELDTRSFDDPTDAAEAMERGVIARSDLEALKKQQESSDPVPAPASDPAPAE